MPRTLLSLLLVLAAAPVAESRTHAWPEPASQAAPSPGEELRVFVMTMGPGDAVWERFGHNALWIHDPVRGTDKAYNYGLFHFGQPGFVRNFVQGRMLYWMGGFDAYQTAAQYQAANRSVWVQELNLTPAQKLALQEFLEWNERPENTYYRYDYYRDNCSTRIRDALDRALGGQIRAQTEDALTESTYRSHTRRLTADAPHLDFGIKLASGQPVDRRISVWEEMFLPVEMQGHLRGLTVRDEAGREAALVLAEETWFIADREDPPAVPPRAWPAYLLAGLLLGGLMAGLGALAADRRGAALGFGLVAGLWLLFAGVFGTLIAGLWAFTDHYVTYRNENVLQFHPLALVLVVVLAFVARGRRRLGPAALWLGLAVAGLALLGALLKLLPGFHQVNGAILALAVPAHLGMAWGLWRVLSPASTERGERAAEAPRAGPGGIRRSRAESPAASPP